MDKIIVQRYNAIPVGVDKIIKGKLLQGFDEISGKPFNVGDGVILYDVRQPRDIPAFPLILKK